MFSLKNFRGYKKRPICVDLSINQSLCFGELIKFRSKIKKIINKKSLIFLVYSNNIDFIAIYLSILNLKIVPLILNEKIHNSFLDNLKKIYKPKLIFLPKSLKNNKKYLNFSKHYSYKIMNQKSFYIDKKVALLISTSGTTGSHKNVVCSYKNLYSSASSISTYLKISKDDKPLMTLPASYVYGLSILNSHILKHSTIFITSQNFLSRSFWKIVE